MKKVLIFLAAAVLPFASYAQEVGLESNYKTKKEKRMEKFKSHQSGELIIHVGPVAFSGGFGLMGTVGAEYMLNSKMGIRTSYSSNGISSMSYWGGYNRLSADVTYHFIQNARWDVYAFAGLGAERLHYRYGTSGDQLYSNIKPFLNGGVGARYRITPSFGLQAEVGRTTNFGIFKKFNLGER